MNGVAPSEQTKHRLLSALGLYDPASRSTHAADRTALLPPADDSLPERIGGVRLTRRLGRGGMGQVWFGRHEALDIDVAVKVLAPDVHEGDLLIQEARAAVRLQHPHVVRILHAGEEDGRRFIVMEHLPGGDVAQLLIREGRIPWRRAVDLVLQAAEGLAEAHRLGLVHRDVKPANFLLDANGAVKVADFGLVQRIGYRRAPAGIAHGTPAYMPPEQALGQAITPAADVYALGVTLYQLLTGSKPFRGENTSRLLQAHLQQPLPDPRVGAPGIPDDLVTLLRAMTAKDPAGRPADGAAVALRLRGLAADDGAAPPRPRRAFAFAVGIAALAVVVVGGWLAGRRPDAAAPTPPAIAVAGAVAGAGMAGADTWRTPPRAVFVLAQDVPVEAEAAIDRALRGTGLTVVERQRIEGIAGEQRMRRDGLVDAGSGVALGRLVGGHIALIARGGAAGVHLATVAVETGERVASGVAPADGAAREVADLVHAALATMPVRGYADATGSGQARLDIGSAHGVRPGDVFSIHGGTPADPGGPVAIGRVVVVSRDTADLAVQGAAPKRRALAQRLEP